MVDVHELERERARWERLALGKRASQTTTGGGPAEPLLCLQTLAEHCRERAAERAPALEPTLGSLETLLRALHPTALPPPSGEAAQQMRREVMTLLDTLEILMDAVLLAPHLQVSPVVGVPSREQAGARVKT